MSADQPDSSHGSTGSALDDISVWLGKLKQGDDRAPDMIWNEYFGRLVRLAERKMMATKRRSVGEEDVALSALKSFIMGAQDGKYPDLEDSSDLWKLLVVITVRKIVSHQRRNFAQKRGGGAVRGESVFAVPGESDGPRGIEQILGGSPSPELAAEFGETLDGLVDQLDDDRLKTIVASKLEGYTNREIADRLGCTERTIERKLERIRQQWGDLVGDSGD